MRPNYGNSTKVLFSCCMRIPGTGGSMGITVKPRLTATSYYIHFFGSLLAEVSHDEAIVVCIVVRDLC